MPVSLESMSAKSSSYQHNGSLNALVHALVLQMSTIGDPETQHRVCKAFYAEWDAYLNWEQLETVFEHTPDPIHREMLLGPVLRRLLPDEEIGQRGSRGCAEVAVASVATLAKTFGIRLESYTTYAGLKAALSEPLLKQYPGLGEEALKGRLDKALKARIRAEILAKVRVDRDNAGLLQSQLLAKAETELQRIAQGHRPHYAQSLEDGLGVDVDRLAVEDPRRTATLRIVRVGTGYQFGIHRRGEPVHQVYPMDAWGHNLSYERPVLPYEKAAPFLRDRLKGILMGAAAREGAAFDRQASLEANIPSVFRDFLSNPEQPKNPAPEGDSLGGLMKNLRGKVSTFFSHDLGGSVKGFEGIFKSLLGPLLKIIGLFQEKILDMHQQPGDPLSKEAIEKDKASIPAAAGFSIGVSALGKGTIRAKRLNAPWQAHPDTPEVWIDRMKALVEAGELTEAEACLEVQEARFLEMLERLASIRHPNQPQRQPAKALFDPYHTPVDPLKDRTFLEALTGPEKENSLRARLNVLKSLEAKTQALLAHHTTLKQTVEQRKRRDERRLFEDEQGVAQGTVPALAARFAEVQQSFQQLYDQEGTLKETQNGFLENLDVRPIVAQFEGCRNLKGRFDAAIEARQCVRARMP